jgi:hypothetical protein
MGDTKSNDRLEKLWSRGDRASRGGTTGKPIAPLAVNAHLLIKGKVDSIVDKHRHNLSLFLKGLKQKLV